MATARPVDSEGKVIHKYPLERCLAHELTHAAQPYDLEGVRAYRNASQAIALKVQLQHLGHSYLVPYRSRLQAARDASQVAAIAGEIYDRHLVEHLESMTEEFIALAKQDPAIRHYIEKRETPAIAAENRIALDRGETLRSTDYLHNTANEVIAAGTARSDYMAALVQRYMSKQQVPTRVWDEIHRKSGRTRDPKHLRNLDADKRNESTRSTLRRALTS